jgi:DNA-binding transcriptional ArsR family regulator
MDNTEELAEKLKALSDPTRLRLVKLLRDQTGHDECHSLCHGHRFLCVNALAQRLGVTQSAVSQHLRVLRLAGFVRGDRYGSFMHYSLDEEALERCQAALREALGGELGKG